MCSLADVVIAVLGIRHDVTARQRSAAGQRDPIDRLAEALHAKKLMLVIDNCEHMIEPVADLAERLLHAAGTAGPGNQPGTAGARRRGYLDRSAPRTARTDRRCRPRDCERVRCESEAVLARAAATSPGFALNPDNAEAVAGEICDGSTEFRWRWSWPLRGSGRWAYTSSWSGWTTALNCWPPDSRCPGAAEITPGDDRLELGTTEQGRTGRPAPAGSARRKLDSQGRRSRVRRRGYAGQRILDLLARLVDRSSST